METDLERLERLNAEWTEAVANTTPGGAEHRAAVRALANIQPALAAARAAVTSGFVLPDSWHLGGLLEQDADLGLVLVGNLARYPVKVTTTGKLRRTSRLGTFGIRCRVEFLEAEGMGPAVVHGWMTDPRLV